MFTTTGFNEMAGILKILEKKGVWIKKLFSKKIAKKWILRKICHAQVGSPKGKGCYWDKHELVNEGEKIIGKPHWEWAEWADNQIYYAEKGILYKLKIQTSNKLTEAKLLHNFNDYKFEYIQAPY